ncbi:UNVERIFIED_CONTAM: hypothetical protein NCL1_16102 [Trichonephila clavipes]
MSEDVKIFERKMDALYTYGSERTENDNEHILLHSVTMQSIEEYSVEVVMDGYLLCFIVTLSKVRGVIRAT